MLQAQLPKESTPSLNILRQVPKTYTDAWRLAGADTTEYKEWNNGYLLTEGLHSGDQIVQLFVLHVHHRQRIYFTAGSKLTALWHMFSGESEYVLEGLGGNRLSAGKCALSYMPAHLEHFAIYEPGSHVFMCVSVLPMHLEAHRPRLPQLLHFEKWARQGGNRAWQQPVLSVTDTIKVAFDSLLTSGKPAEVPPCSAVAIAEYKTLLYQSMKRHSIEDRHIEQALQLKILLDTWNRLSRPVGEAFRMAGIGEYEGERAFKYLTGQTPFAYLREQKLLLIRELLWHGGKQVKELQDLVGLGANAIVKLFKARFGMTIKEFLETRRKW